MQWTRSSWLSVFTFCALAGTACAQVAVPITVWNFNSNPSDSNTGTGTLSPALGLGSASLFGGAIQDVFNTGSPNDTNTGDNSGWQTTGYSQDRFVGSGLRGVEFAVSTANFTDIVVTWDQRHSSTTSRFVQASYSIDGVNFTDIGAPFEAVNGQAYYLDRQIDFAALGVTSVNNNPNFKFRVAPVFAPGTNPPEFLPATPGGTYGTGGLGGGTQRYDLVRITGVPIGQTNPSGQAIVEPGAVCNTGGQVLFTVTTNPGQLPTSTGITVTGNLGIIGGSTMQPLFDNGTNGDAVAGDGTFSYLATVPNGVIVGNNTVNFTVRDAQNRSATASTQVNIANCSTPSTSRVVISQIFGGGSNLGPPAGVYNADFIEIFNRSATPVDLNGWSIQYASPQSGGGFDNPNDRVALSGIIKPGQYMLIRMSDEGPSGSALPTPDLSVAPNRGGVGNTGGRVALVRSSGLIGSNCADANIEDLAGYGAAVCFEGAGPVAVTANDTAAVRKGNGAQDFNQNFNDFLVAAPMPRNRATGGFLVGAPGALPSAVCAGTAVTLTVAVTPAASPASTGISVSANLTSLGGSASAALLDNGLNGDQFAGDGVYTLVHTIASATTQGTTAITFSTTDAQGRSDSISRSIDVGTCVPSSSPVVISQVFGGGGNNGSIFNADFIEIFNRSASPVSLDGWSVQYAAPASAVGFLTNVIPLSGTIGPGEYRLIVTNAPSPDNGVAIPPADFVPATQFGMDNEFARVALVNSTTPVGSNCGSASVVDLVGYGVTAICFEGLAPTLNLSNALAAVRKGNGCQDFNQTAIDFDVLTPFDLPRNSSSPANPCPTSDSTCCRGTTSILTSAAACTAPAGVGVAFLSGTGAVNGVSNTAPCCYADFNKDGSRNIDDIFIYLNAWFGVASNPFAKINGNGVATANIDDLFVFINIWFAGGCG